MPGALGSGGVVAALGIPAAADGAVFRAHLERVLLPDPRRRRPDAVPVMDDLAAYRTEAVRAPPDASGSGYPTRRPARPTPDRGRGQALDPIEPARAGVEALLRKAAARTASGPHAALGPALDAATARDARGYFRHAGHPRPD